MHLSIIVLVVLIFAVAAVAEVKTETVNYREGGTNLKGFLAYDDKLAGRQPGVLVVPEWWGLNDYPRSRSEQLARLGYVAFAADMYGEGTTTRSAEEAGKLAGGVRSNPQIELARIRAAYDQLKANPHVDPAKIAVIGYCFGGGVALDFARSGADLRGAVSFHGTLQSSLTAAPRSIKAQILVLTGADDPMVTMSQVSAFVGEMKNAGANFQVNIYSHAVHAFTNPNAGQAGIPGVAYNATADQRSWQAMKDFFAEIFK